MPPPKQIRGHPRVGSGAGRFGGRKGVSKIVASVRGLPQLPLPLLFSGFRVGFPYVPAFRVFAPGSPPGVAGPPAAISPGYCCPDLSVIDRSCWCLCDPGSMWRFLGSDAAAGDGLWGCGRAGVWRCAGWIAAGGWGDGDKRFLRGWRRNRGSGGRDGAHFGCEPHTPR